MPLFRHIFWCLFIVTSSKFCHAQFPYFEKISAEMPPLPAPIIAIPIPPPPVLLLEERRLSPAVESNHRCNGESVTLTSLDGSITWRSPWSAEESKYLKNIDTCYWFIRLPSNFRIRLTFDSFDVVDSPGCSGDHLVVFDTAGSVPNHRTQPNWAGNTPVATLCGNPEQIKPIESRGSEIMVAFRSFSHLAPENNNHGFKISYHGIEDGKQANQAVKEPINNEERPLEEEEYYEDEEAGEGLLEDEPPPLPTEVTTTAVTKTTRVHFIYPRNFSQLDAIRPTPALPFRPLIRPVSGAGDLKPLNPAKVTPDLKSPWSRVKNVYPINHREVTTAKAAPPSQQRWTTEPIKRLYRIMTTTTTAAPKGTSNQFLSDHSHNAHQSMNANAKCNGRIRLLTAESGQLSSPNFGYGNYFSNDLCFWQIIAPEDKRIRLGFSFLMLQPESGCYADYLNIYDGASETGSLIAAFCGAKSPPPDREILTTGNTAFIKFSTDDGGEFPGFQMGYEFFDASASASIDAYAGNKNSNSPQMSPQKAPSRGHPPLTGETYCGGRRQLLFAPSGTIESPGFKSSPASSPVTNKAPDECFWLISAPADGKVRVTFKELNLRHSYKCPDDSVSLYEGRADPSEGPKTGGVDLGRLLATFCGPSLPMPITSDTNELLIGYTTRGGRLAENHGFKLEYEQIQSPEPICMGRMITLTSSPGYISTPNYGRGNYAANDQCSWLLVAAPHQRIKLVFEKFSLEDSANCVKDSLILFDVGDYYDGGEHGGETLHRAPLRDLCGHDIPTTVLSETNSVEIKFISDSNGEDRGASIFFEFVDAYPPKREDERTYRQNKHTPPPSRRHHHQKQPQSQQQRQEHYQDWRTFRRTKPMMRTTTPTWVTTTVEAPYEDDYTSQEEEEENPMVPVPKLVQGPDGFVAILARDPVEKTGEPDISSVVGRCGNKSSILTTESGFIESPGFRRGFYPDADECQWLIIADAKRRVRLFFETFDIELEPLCSHDSLTVYDGPTESAEPLGVYCGQGQPDPVESSGPYTLVRFHSDAAGSGKGFKLYYNFTSGPVEPIVSTTVIALANSRSARITTTTTSPPSFRPKPDGSGVDNATMAFLQALIRGVVKGSHEKMESELFTSKQPRREEIIVTVPSSHNEPKSIQVAGSPNLELIPKFEPSSSFLEPSPDVIPLVAQTMGPYTWPPLTTTVQLSTTSGRPLYSAINDRCRGRVGVIVLNAALGKRGSLASPNFGTANYANEDVCRWEIRSPTPRTRIRLRFVKFHLEGGSPLCQNDFVEIFDGPGANFPLLGRYCGEQLPSNVVSSGNQLALRFVSDGMLSYAGFYAEFGAEPIDDWVVTTPGFFVETIPQETTPTTTVATTTTTELPTTIPKTVATTTFPPTTTVVEQERCDGRLHQLVATALPQFFTSPNFGPGRTYPTRDVCYWIVTSPSRFSSRVRLTFRYFSLEPPSPRCHPGDSLSIFDGPAETAPLLAVHCGSTLPREIISETSSSLFIKFESDGAHNFPGFVAAFDDFSSVLAAQRRQNETTTASPRPIIRPVVKNEDYYDDGEGNRPQIVQLPPSNDPFEDLPPPLPPYLDPARGKKHRKNKTKRRRWSCLNLDGSPVNLRAGRSARFLTSHEDFAVDEGGASTFYPPNLDCSWLITANQSGVDERIRLTFEEFRVERGLSDISCLSDYVVIFDGATEESETVRKLCGIDGKDFSFISTTPNLLINFHTDRTVEDAGFRLRYESVSVHSANKYLDNLRPCGGRLLRLPPATAQQVQTFSSPNYGSGRKYFPNDSCKWLIVSEQLTSKIRLRFVTFFVENRTPNCANDHIIVYDGSDETSPVIGKFCGLQTPPELSSTGRKMLIRFFSDNSIEYSGFSAEYSTSQENLLTEERTEGAPSSSDGVLFKEEQTSTSSSTASTAITIEMTTNAEKEVSLNDGMPFSGPIEPDNYYSHYSNHYHQQTAVGRSAANSHNHELAGASGPMPLVDTSIPYTHNHPRSLARCNGQVYPVALQAPELSQWENETAVVVVSPNFYAHSYAYNDECMWSVTVSNANSRIRFHFDDFEVQYSDGCYKDRLLIYDGGISGPKVFGPFCGQIQLPDILTQTSKALIKFNTDEAYEMRGFRMTLTATAPAETTTSTSTSTTTTTTTTTTTIKPTTTTTTTKTKTTAITTATEEPDHWPGLGIEVEEEAKQETGSTGPSEHSFVDAKWFTRNERAKRPIIKDVDQDKSLQIEHIWQEPKLEIVESTRKAPTFVLPDFDFTKYQAKSAVSGDEKQVFEVQTEETTTTTTPEITTITADDITTTIGEFELERLHEPCRERLFEFDSSLSAEKRVFASPADTANGRYFANDICYYQIKAPPGQRVRLDFFEPFDLEGSITCLYDKLRVYDGANEQSPLGGTYCGMSPPEPYISTENMIFIKFQSDSTQNRAGFVVKFSYV